MESILIPKTVSIEQDKKDPNSSTVVIAPLYPGYGPTIANSLRRVLFSSLPGAAIFAFKIKGVTHEFTSIDYVKEDVVDISLNLKKVNLTSHTDEIVELTVKSNGEGVITAGDIEKNSDIEIANPEQAIMTLTDKAASIEMTLWVKTGRGYETVESRQEEDLEVNAISIDAIFTPVRQVGYEVDSVRVGDKTNYDKITMRVETNGTISIEDALLQSSSILADHFKAIGNLSSGGGKEAREEDSESEQSEEKKEDIKESE